MARCSGPRTRPAACGATSRREEGRWDHGGLQERAGRPTAMPRPVPLGHARREALSRNFPRAGACEIAGRQGRGGSRSHPCRPKGPRGSRRPPRVARPDKRPARLGRRSRPLRGRGRRRGRPRRASGRPGSRAAARALAPMIRTSKATVLLPSKTRTLRGERDGSHPGAQQQNRRLQPGVRGRIPRPDSRQATLAEQDL
jgi:hypothetical protein